VFIKGSSCGITQKKFVSGFYLTRKEQDKNKMLSSSKVKYKELSFNKLLDQAGSAEINKSQRIVGSFLA
jgi:hypothetical protein